MKLRISLLGACTATWPLVHGCRGLVSLCSMSSSAQANSKAWHRNGSLRASIWRMSSGVQPSPPGSVKCVPLHGQHRVDLVGDGGGEGAEEVAGDATGGLFVQLYEGELRGPVDGDEEVEPAFLRPDLGNTRCGSSRSASA